jgi:phenylalanyl-tRNA synthetase beta chain
MKVPLSWLRDYIDIDGSISELAHRMTLAGLEVEAVQFVGLPVEEARGDSATRGKVGGLAWDPDKIVVGAIWEVMPHPNADRLVLCRLDDGVQEQTVLTGAPNLFPYKGKGRLERPIQVAYAREGARIYDGHQPGYQVTTLRRTKIRGVESSSMACSEKELGISDDHEGVIILDDDAPVGRPLAEYMGDVVLDITLTPNMARNASIEGVAREVAALTGRPRRRPASAPEGTGPSIDGRVSIDIRQPDLNPRFVLGLLEGVTIAPSPYWLQRRLRLAGVRAINNIVDATNYVMLDVGQPLHAFDYDALLRRAGGRPPRLHTRTARPGETLTTLDGVERKLDAFTVLVCDDAGSLSIAGVMGGAESEVHPATRNVLLEGAAWNFINIRRTTAAQHLTSEAAYRFSRGVHPALAEAGVRRGLALMQRLGGGAAAAGLVDAYPRPPADPVVSLGGDDVERALGVRLSSEEIADILRRLEFDVQRGGDHLRVTTPPHRLDIGEGIIGIADLVEEVARIYGYDRIPETLLADTLPPQRGNSLQELEEALRDALVGVGLQELVTYRLTTPENDGRTGEVTPGSPYVRLTNPIASDRVVMRRSLLTSVLEAIDTNHRLRERLAVFEIGPVYVQTEGVALPEEIPQVVVALSGRRHPRAWPRDGEDGWLDFLDLKGLVVEALEALHLSGLRVSPGEHPAFHPGKCAEVWAGDRRLGVLGEIHPHVHARFDMGEAPVAAAEMDLHAVLVSVPEQRPIASVPAFPPILEDLAFIVDDEVPAGEVEAQIHQAGAPLLSSLRLFDVFRGGQIGEGKKSLAYSLVYQAPDRTLTDDEVAEVRRQIVAHLEQTLGAKLRA